MPCTVNVWEFYQLTNKSNVLRLSNRLFFIKWYWLQWFSRDNVTKLAHYQSCVYCRAIDIYLLLFFCVWRACISAMRSYVEHCWIFNSIVYRHWLCAFGLFLIQHRKIAIGKHLAMCGIGSFFRQIKRHVYNKRGGYQPIIEDAENEGMQDWFYVHILCVCLCFVAIRWIPMNNSDGKRPTIFSTFSKNHDVKWRMVRSHLDL